MCGTFKLLKEEMTKTKFQEGKYFRRRIFFEYLEDSKNFKISKDYHRKHSASTNLDKTRKNLVPM